MILTPLIFKTVAIFVGCVAIYSTIQYVSKKGTELFSKEKQTKDMDEDFSLLLITTAEKIRGSIDVSAGLNGEYNQEVSLETVKKLINTSRYFLIENAEDNILSIAKTSDNLPDLEKDNFFILKITGKGKHNIATCKTKLGLRDSITSEPCKIEKVLHLLNAGIAEKFIATI